MSVNGATEGEAAAPHSVAVGAASAFAAAASLTGLEELRRKLPHGSAGRKVNSFVLPWHPDALEHQRGLHVAMQADRHDSLRSIWDERDPSVAFRMRYLRLQAASDSPVQAAFDAAGKDCIEDIHVLHAVGVDLFGIRSTSGLNCLMIAAQKGSPRVLQFCLDNGGDANDDDTHGGTALTAAACYAHPECARILIAAGANVAHAYSGDNATIVYMMCLVFSNLSSVEVQGQYVETLTLLLASGAPRDTVTAPDLMAMVSFEWMGGGDTGRGKNALSLLVAEPEGGVESKDASWISERASLRALLAPSSSALAALLAAQEESEEEESDESNEKLEEEDGRMPLTYDADGMLDASQMTDEQKEQLNAILSSML